jgi:protease II
MVILLSASCGRSTNENLKYPDTRKGDVADTIFGVPVADPYRWLEDDMSEETEEWVKARNNITFGYLDKISYRDQRRERLMEIWNYEKFSIPFREGDYIYFAKMMAFRISMYITVRKKEENLNFSSILTVFLLTALLPSQKWVSQKMVPDWHILFQKEDPTGAKLLSWTPIQNK